MMRNFFFLLILFLSVNISKAQTDFCIVEAKADTTDMLIGEQTTITVTAKVRAGERVFFPTYNAEEEIVPGLEVVRNGRIDTLDVDGGKRWELSRRYVVTSFDSAIYAVIPEVYINGDTLKARNTIGLKVESVPVDTTQLDNFVGPYGSVDEEFDLDWMFLLGIVMLMGISAWLAFLIRKYRKSKPLPPQIIVEQVSSPHADALAAIAKIRQMPRNTKEDNETYYSRLSDILRQYLKRRFDVDALNMTTSEIIGVLIKEQNVALLNELGDILNTSDLVKFAQYTASLNESDKNLLQAADYIHNTRIQAQELQPKVVSIEPEGNAEKRKKRKTIRKYLIAASVVLVFLLIYVSKVIIEIFF